MRPVIPALLCLGALVACAAPEPDPAPLPVPDPIDVLLVGSSVCSEEAFAPMVGRPLTVLDTIETPELVRVIGPGDIYSEEYRPERLNVGHNGEGVVVKVWCG